MSAVFLSLTVILVLCVYKLLTKKHDVFKQRGVRFQKPVVLFGNMFDAFVWGESLESAIGILYEKFSREKLFGVFILHRPVFVIKDPDLVHQILIERSKSFTRYSDGSINGKVERTIQLSDRDECSKIRNTFNCDDSSATKLKQNLFKGAAENCLSFIQRRQNRNLIEFETENVFERFIAESIATAVLGDSSCEKINRVLDVVKFIKEDLTSFTASVKVTMNLLMPRFFRMKLLRKEVQGFYKTFLVEVNEKREKAENNNDDQRGDQLFTQFLTLFSGGFEATRKLLQACFLELSTHQDIQSQLIKEIESLNSDLSLLHSTKLLDKVIQEALRKHPPVKSLRRICRRNCLIKTRDGEVLKFVVNDVIHVPIDLIQNDDMLLRKPGGFDVSKFDNNRRLLAFGLGSSRCFGAQLVLLQVKVLIFTFLTKYSIQSCERIDDVNSLVRLKPR